MTHYYRTGKCITFRIDEKKNGSITGISIILLHMLWVDTFISYWKPESYAIRVQWNHWTNLNVHYSGLVKLFSICLFTFFFVSRCLFSHSFLFRQFRPTIMPHRVRTTLSERTHKQKINQYCVRTRYELVIDVTVQGLHEFIKCNKLSARYLHCVRTKWYEMEW